MLINLKEQLAELKLSTRGHTDGKSVLFRHILKKIVHTLFWIVSYLDLTLKELRGIGTVNKSMIGKQSMVIRNKGEESVVIIALVATLADVMLRCQTD